MSILTKEGYLLLKKNYSEKELTKIKNDLTVTPHVTFKIGNSNLKPESFTVYEENDNYLSLPKFYGISKFGQPSENKEIIGETANITFTGTIRSKQQDIINDILPKLENNGGGLLCLGCGSGKCLAKDTIILMYDGTTSLVQNIKINDKIMGDDSLPRTILSIARGIETMYKVHQPCGNFYIVNESHILSLKNDKNKIIDISVSDYLKKSEELFGYRVPITFKNKVLEIDPYLFGFLLVDNLSNKKLDNNFISFLNKYDIFNNKHIPLHYKCNSRENQLTLLAGIIDSKGKYNNNYYQIILDNDEKISYYSSDIYDGLIVAPGETDKIFRNEKLSNDIIYLARSLGYSAFKKELYTTDQKTDKYYFINIYGSNLEEIPVLCFKDISISQLPIINHLQYKIKLEKLEKDDYYGFEIDGNKRFVLGDFTVTHNTVIALYIASILKVKTLVIVHKSFLLNQWIQRAKEFTDANIGILQQKKIDIGGKQIVIGMLQSIAKDKYDSEIFRDFGLVIFDEAHHAPSKYFSRSLPIIACKKTLALSATPKRADKLEKVLHWYFGPILYEEIGQTISGLQVKIFKYNINHKNFKEYKLYDGSVNRAKTINKLVEIEKRNEFIVEQIKQILLEEGRKLIILSDRVEHLNVLKALLDNLEIATTSLYIGGMKQKKLDESEKAQVIFGTYSMASEALDIPELNTLVMATSRKEIEQTVGRITRKKDHPVQPLIIDILDQLPSFNRQGEVRKKFYIKKDFKIKIYDVEENEILNEMEYIKQNKTNIINNDDVDFID